MRLTNEKGLIPIRYQPLEAQNNDLHADLNRLFELLLRCSLAAFVSNAQQVIAYPHLGGHRLDIQLMLG